jgi:hypothetical protein
MNFNIVSDTAGSKVKELSSELIKLLEDNVNEQYKHLVVSIGIAIRCLPESYNRKSFIRYTKADNYLTIDFCVLVEEYEKKYKIEQRFELGKVFLEWLEQGLQNKKFIEGNPNLNANDLLQFVKTLGQKHGWFLDEIDLSLDLDK